MGRKRVILKFAVFIFALVIFSSSAFAAAISVSDLAGSGEASYIDGKAPTAGFSYPCGLAVDTDGGLLVADSGNNRIRKIKDGTVTTVAGSSHKQDSFGSPLGGYADGAAATAEFNDPRSLALDAKGNIYVSDSGNNVIRKISGGKVYTFTGTGKAGYTDGKRSAAQFSNPLGIAVDRAGNIFVADSLNNVIRIVSQDGGVMTFAGQYSKNGGYKDGPVGEALFNEPSDIAFDKKGVLYILDSGNQLVRKVENGVVSTLAGVWGDPSPDTGYSKGGFKNGSLAEAQFNFPKGLNVTEDGTILIADTWNHCIRAITTGGKVVTAAGTGLPGNTLGNISTAEFNGPADVLYASGVLYISDMWNNRIKSISADIKDLAGITDRDELLKNSGFTAKTDDIQVWMDGRKLVFKDAAPVSDMGRVYLPVRAICEAWGTGVSYDSKAKAIYVVKDGFLIKTIATGKEQLKNVKGRILMASDRLSGYLGFRIEWYPDSNAVVIVTN